MGTLIIGATITVSADIPVYQISYECHSSLTNFVIQSLTAQFSPVEVELDQTVGFSLPLDKFQFNHI